MSFDPDFPTVALSVRQPWAWAIFNGKDVENRGRVAVTKGDMKPRRIAIHAAKGMTRFEYEDAKEFMEKLGVQCPKPNELLRGGIIGSVDVVAIVNKCASPWFMGPKGLVLSNARTCEFIPAVGALGFFRWKAADYSVVPAPAVWMTEQKIKRHNLDERMPELFTEVE